MGSEKQKELLLVFMYEIWIKGAARTIIKKDLMLPKMQKCNNEITLMQVAVSVKNFLLACNLGYIVSFKHWGSEKKN
ncbi:hypothetical protein AS888_24010 [Peribacillus simplex]|uniref:Uncharacterized protein n=1 Tax=Peribacillus simplex TaxID=1478 RepID=A0A109MVQ0_9BACI|nr:hypothetical protein AS888_24010 [Peribacillus simplex]